MLMIISTFSITIPIAKADENFIFDSENVITGISANSANRNAEDGVFQTLTESDQYTDNNYSGSSESMTYGTTGGGSFPSALDTDDSTRRNYIEVNLEPSNYIVYLFPSSDSSVNWNTVFPTSPTTHYDKLDEKTLGGDSDTTYVETSSSSDRDVFTMSDISTPSGTPTFVVQTWAYAMRTAGGTMNFQEGIVSGGTDYIAYSGVLTAGYLNYSKGWLVDPKDSTVWTTTKINALNTYMTSSDTIPNPRVTQIGICVYVNYSSTDYQMQGTITYNSVITSSQTTGLSVICQGYRSNSENFYIQAWNYTSSAWITKTTINSASDTNFNFNLLGWAVNCERSSGNVVQLRLIDASGTDVTQDTLYLDLLKINEVKTGYALSIEMTSETTNQYGNQRLYIKGKTSSESFNIGVYNWTVSSYDTEKIVINSGTNTVYTYTLITQHHRSVSYLIKIIFTDAIAYTTDFSQDICSLDVAFVQWLYTSPTLSNFDINPDTNIYTTTEVNFTMTYTSFDNYAPLNVVLFITEGDKVMLEIDSYDTNYIDGKDYYISSNFSLHGIHYYTFGILYYDDWITGGDNYFTIENRNPTITSSGNITQTEDTFLSYQIIASDPDGDSINYALSSNASWASITSNYVNGTATPIGWYNFYVWVNDSYSGTTNEYWTLNVTAGFINTPPYFTSSPILNGTNITWYVYITIAFDADLDELIYSLSEDTNATFLSINSTSSIIYGTPVFEGNYSVNITVFDGTAYAYQNYTLSIEPFSGGAITDWNLIGVLGMIIGMLISIGVFSFINPKRKEGKENG